jgi:lysophospholipase L1-like esterase
VEASLVKASLIKKIVFSVFVLALSLAAAEISLRIIVGKRTNIVFQALGKHMKNVHLEFFSNVVENDPELFWKFRPDQTLPPELPGVHGLISNGAGLREDHEIPLEKPDGQIRILFVGDSCTFGFGLTHDQAFVDMTEKQIQKMLPGVNVECINAGVPGYTIVQGWRYVETRGLDFKPDLILVAFGWNESKHWMTRDDLETYEDRKRSTPPSILAKSEICQQLWKRIYPAPKRTDPVARVNAGEYELLLQRIYALAEARGIEFVPIILPLLKNVEVQDDAHVSDYQKVGYAWGRQAEPFGPDERPRYIDLVPAFRGAIAEKIATAELFMDGVHTLPRGNKIIAETIAEYIAPWLNEKAARAGL